MTEDRGLFKKYVIKKADGREVSPDASYFVLRLDKDDDWGKISRKALKSVLKDIEKISKPLAKELTDEILKYENFLVPHDNKSHGVPFSFLLQKLKEADGDFRFFYRDKKGNESLRIISTPWQLSHNSTEEHPEGDFTLKGYDLELQSETIFSVRNIISIED